MKVSVKSWKNSYFVLKICSFFCFYQPELSFQLEENGWRQGCTFPPDEQLTRPLLEKRLTIFIVSDCLQSCSSYPESIFKYCRKKSIWQYLSYIRLLPIMPQLPQINPKGKGWPFSYVPTLTNLSGTQSDYKKETEKNRDWKQVMCVPFCCCQTLLFQN